MDQPDSLAAADSLLASGRALLEDLQSALQGRARLVSLELRQAGLALMQIVMLSVAAGLLIASSWAALMACLYMAALAAGLNWPLAAAAVLGLNLAGAAVIWSKGRQLTAHLMFEATVRALGPAARPLPESPARAPELPVTRPAQGAGAAS